MATAAPETKTRATSQPEGSDRASSLAENEAEVHELGDADAPAVVKTDIHQAACADFHRGSTGRGAATSLQEAAEAAAPPQTPEPALQEQAELLTAEPTRMHIGAEVKEEVAKSDPEAEAEDEEDEEDQAVELEDPANLLQDMFPDRDFWAALADTDAARLRSAASGLALLRQQLRRNEHLMVSLHEQIAGREKACRSLRRRTQRAEQESMTAAEREEKAVISAERVTRQRQQRQTGADSLEQYRARCDSVQVESSAVRTLLDASRERLVTLRADTTRSAQRVAAQDRERTAVDFERTQVLSVLRESQAQALVDEQPIWELTLAELEEQRLLSLEKVRSRNSIEAAELHRQVELATEEMDRRGAERDGVRAQLAARQREAGQLQQLCADARAEVLDLALLVREASFRVPEPTALDELLEMAEEADPGLEDDLVDLRQQCKSLERECARAQDTLEKKRAELERGKSRLLHHGSAGRGVGVAGAIGARRAAPSGAPHAPSRQNYCRPFTLGPADEEVHGLI